MNEWIYRIVLHPHWFQSDNTNKKGYDFQINGSIVNKLLNLAPSLLLFSTPAHGSAENLVLTLEFCHSKVVEAMDCKNAPPTLVEVHFLSQKVFAIALVVKKLCNFLSGFSGHVLGIRIAWHKLAFPCYFIRTPICKSWCLYSRIRHCQDDLLCSAGDLESDMQHLRCLK